MTGNHTCRHSIQLTDDGMEAVVGWDAPLETYFIQVGDDVENCGTEDLFLWAGGNVAEIPTVVALRDVYRAWAKTCPAVDRELPIDPILVTHLIEASEVKPFVVTIRPGW